MVVDNRNKVRFIHSFIHSSYSLVKKRTKDHLNFSVNARVEIVDSTRRRTFEGVEESAPLQPSLDLTRKKKSLNTLFDQIINEVTVTCEMKGQILPQSDMTIIARGFSEK